MRSVLSFEGLLPAVSPVFSRKVARLLSFYHICTGFKNFPSFSFLHLLQMKSILWEETRMFSVVQPSSSSRQTSQALVLDLGLERVTFFWLEPGYSSLRSPLLPLQELNSYFTRQGKNDQGPVIQWCSTQDETSSPKLRME